MSQPHIGAAYLREDCPDMAAEVVVAMGYALDNFMPKSLDGVRHG